MQSEPWTDERVNTLKKLWAKGETAETIAAKLGGLSRSAVLGKVFRLRLKPVAAGKKLPVQAAKKPGASEPIERRRRGIEPAKPESAKAGRQGKTLFELTNECCRWPYRRPGTERYFFCGAAEADLAGGIPYCPRHMRRAYLVAPAIIVRSRSVTARAARQHAA
jgi:GcrA cell cycle regulator